jgi:ATP-binding cassette subfamily B protein
MISAGNVSGIYTPLVQTIGVLGQILVIAIGGQQVLAGDLQIGELIAFVLYLGAFFAPIQELTNLYNTYQSGQAAVRKLADLLDDEPSVVEGAGASELHIDRGSVTFEHVTFGYREDTPVVDEIDLHIEPGESIALVGETGAGKSTLSKLITRTYDPQRGRILVDGQDIAAVTITSLRAAIGVVPQEPFLFSGSLRHNLTIGRPDAPDDDVLAICRALGLGRLLARLGGLDGELAERGVGLSAGERQLVALARALVPGPHLLVLDEATSNLDLRSERQVEHALDVALEGRTAILIAHRLSTAERADRVIVMKDGRIVEVGHHDELVAAGGHYATMHATWVTSAA